MSKSPEPKEAGEEPEVAILIDESPAEEVEVQSAAESDSESKQSDQDKTDKDVPPSPAFKDVSNDNDELAELRGEGRYFGVTDPELSQPICSNCHRRGHIRVNCKVVVCHACGKVDDHYETQCPNSMVCSNCGERGHFRNQCKEKRKYNYCTDCDSKNHSNDRCPNIWRSYITISHNSSHKFAYPTSSIYCYNCAQRGHYGDECRMGRVSKTPNINGSAFTGENLPRELRNQYRKNIRNMKDDYYGREDHYGRNEYSNHSKTQYNGKRRPDLYDEYSRKPNYNAYPPPPRPKNSGVLPYNNQPRASKSGVLVPSGPSSTQQQQPTRSGYIDMRKSGQKSRGGGSNGGKADQGKRSANGGNANGSVKRKKRKYQP